jgi:hypothetical protein
VYRARISLATALRNPTSPKINEITLGSSDAKSHVQEGKKTLERELARAKISANRVAVVVANEWKDANDKVMPVKQWLDERKFLQVSRLICSLISM